jgi:hypothetical protein
MCTEASTALRALAADFYFNFRIWRSFRVTLFGTCQGASSIMRKSYIPDWFEYFLHMRSLLLMGSFDLRFLVFSVLRTMCLCQVGLLSRRSPRYLTSSWGCCASFIWTGGGGIFLFVW